MMNGLGKWYASLVFTLMTATSAFGQPIEYNYTPSHELGEELWTLPIDGKLTLSATGDRLLVASPATNRFYIVDVAMGSYEELDAEYYSGIGEPETHYVADESLVFLAEMKEGDTNGIRVWNMQENTVVKTFPGSKRPSAISAIMLQLMVYPLIVDSFHDDTVAVLPPATNPLVWIDEYRGHYYVSSGDTVHDYRGRNGNREASWPVRSQQSFVRRPSATNWLHVVSRMADSTNPRNNVESINLDTRERVLFADFYPDLPTGKPLIQFVGVSPTTTIVGGYVDSGHQQVVWTFDAEKQESRTIIDPQFLWMGQAALKQYAVTPALDRYLHCWSNENQDSSILRCNRLVEMTVSVDDNQQSVNPTARYSNGVVTIDNLPDGATEASLFTIAGERVAVRSLEQTNSLRAEMPVPDLASGRYILAIQSTRGVASIVLNVLR